MAFSRGSRWSAAWNNALRSRPRKNERARAVAYATEKTLDCSEVRSAQDWCSHEGLVMSYAVPYFHPRRASSSSRPATRLS